jgi:hypothetical protein
MRVGGFHAGEEQDQQQTNSADPASQRPSLELTSVNQNSPSKAGHV